MSFFCIKIITLAYDPVYDHLMMFIHKLTVIMKILKAPEHKYIFLKYS